MTIKRIFKVIIALLLVIALPLAPAPGFLSAIGVSTGVAFAGPGTIKAGEVDCAYICAELGLLLGEGQGVTDEYLAQLTKRYQAAYLTLRLVGKEAEAEQYTGKDNFNDVGHLYEGGQRRTAYLRAHSAQYGWEGDGTNRLMPDDAVTAQQFYKVLLTVLGYQANVDYPYEETLAFAQRTTGMKECANISGGLINDEIAIMMVEALLTYIRGETYTLAEFLAEEGVIDYEKAVELDVISRPENDIIEPIVPVDPEPETPTELIAAEVNASNYAEINIVFNQAISKDSIDRNYIKINNGPLLTTDYVYVLEDGVTLRIYRETGFAAQQGQRVNISISKIRSANGELEMAAITDREVVIYDNQSPSLIKVEAIGLRRVKLVFSEPIRASDAAVKNYSTYKFNGKVYPASDAVVCNGREIYLNFSTPLEVGANRLSIDTNRIYDLAGFPIIDVADYEFNAEDDREPPSVINVDAWREKVVVEFSKEVRDQVRMFWLDGNTRRSAQSAAKDPFERNIITFTFAEGQYLPVSATEIIIEGIVDMNGNTAADYRATVSPKFDTDRPAVVSIESPEANEIIVGFSKPVRLGAANNNRFTLKNSSNVTITVGVQAYTPEGASSPDQRYIKLSGAIPPGTYTLTVTGVEDTTAQANKSAESVHTVLVADKAAPQIVNVSVNIAQSKVVLVFNKQLDWNTASDAANYQYFVPGSGHRTVPAGTVPLLEADGMSVVLSFPTGGWIVSGSQIEVNAFTLYIATATRTDELRVLNIKDLNGNAMDPTLIDVPGTNEVAAKLLPAAYAITNQRLMMRFEATGMLPTGAASQDFIVRAGAQNLQFINMSINSINMAARELYIDFDSFELNADGTYGSGHTPVTVAMVAPNQVNNTMTALGTPLEIQGSATVTVTDNIKPGRHEAFRGNRAAGYAANLTNVSYPAITKDQILIVFDELIQFQGVSGAAQLVNIVDVRRDSQPGASIDPSQYTVAAYGDILNDTSSSSAVGTRMIVVTLINPINEGINISVRANTLWDGNKDADGLNVMNNPFDTGFLGAAI